MIEKAKLSIQSGEPTNINGVYYATCCTETKYKNRDDLLLVVLEPGSELSGCFTTSTMPSAPVIWSKKNNEKDQNLNQKIVLLINAGNANAFTGKDGLVACKEKAAALATILKCEKKNIFFASTGVIGEKLPHKKIILCFDYLERNLSPSNFKHASNAILTTDLKPKIYTSKFKVYNKVFQISGFAKGSGMIYPKMATMLAFLFTDFAIDKETLSIFTKKAVEQSFNRISVDGDTSTSDSVFVATTNKIPLKITKDKKVKALNTFYTELKKAMIDLAKKIVMDGEGAKKFIEINVTNARTAASARKICFSIANSLLVKTAIAGEDANWGRLIMAIGKTKINLKIEKIKIYIQNILLCENGQANKKTDDTKLSHALKRKTVNITVDLGEGSKDFMVWTSDLTEDYIKINADYRS